MHEMPRTERAGMQHVTLAEENHQQLWEDTLMMSVLPLAKIGKLLNRPQYVEEAKYQFLVHIKHLMERESGLWFHGWTFAGKHNFAKARWARGNSWLTIVIPEFLELMDLLEYDATRCFLLQVLQCQAMAILCLVEYLNVYLPQPVFWGWELVLCDPCLISITK